MSCFSNAPAWSIPHRTQSASKLKDATLVPGPGKYTSNTRIGNQNPGWKIGTSNRNNQAQNNVPGPGMYDGLLKKSGPQISMGARSKSKVQEQQNNPGPGNYHINDGAIMKSYSGYTMGSKYGTGKVDSSQPGPGSYKIDGGGKQGVKIGTASRNGGTKQKGQTPGVGSYQVDSFRPNSANYSIGGALKSANGKIQMNPGPGHYDTNTFLLQNKGITIGQKYGKNFQPISNLPGPGQYQNSSKRPMSGAKIGRAQRNTMSGSSGPGPGAYYNQYSNTKSAAKIGTGKRYDMGKSDTPGPGSYQTLTQYKGGVTISGVKNRKNIEVTPGPGAYDYMGQNSNKRPCSAKIGRSTRTKFDNSNTPGPGYYNLSNQQNWKFAHTNELRSKDFNKKEPGPGMYDIPPTVPSAPFYELSPPKLGYSRMKF